MTSNDSKRLLLVKVTLLKAQESFCSKVKNAQSYFAQSSQSLKVGPAVFMPAC
jgi:hypothetical protein